MKLVKILFVIIAGLVLTSVTLANHSLDDSQTVSDLSREIVQLEKENIIARAEIADAGSLSRIQERIAGLGFTDTPKIVTLTISSGVASR